MSEREDEEAVDEIRAWFHERGYYLLGPDQPGRGREDLTDEDRQRIGWFAPYVRSDVREGAAAYGWGATSREAAESAQARFTQEQAERGD